jgi:hypothetical protein
MGASHRTESWWTPRCCGGAPRAKSAPRGTRDARLVAHGEMRWDEMRWDAMRLDRVLTTRFTIFVFLIREVTPSTTVGQSQNIQKAAAAETRRRMQEELLISSPTLASPHAFSSLTMRAPSPQPPPDT